MSGYRKEWLYSKFKEILDDAISELEVQLITEQTLTDDLFAWIEAAGPCGTLEHLKVLDGLVKRYREMRQR